MKRSQLEGADRKRRFLVSAIIVLTVAFVLTSGGVANAVAKTRIVVLPFYTEEGRDTKDPAYAAEHYRRVIRFMNNQLVRHGFEVIHPVAKELSEAEYDRVMQRAREDSFLAAREMCKKYATEIAYIIWLRVQVRKTADGYWKATAIVDGDGYDSAGRDLGVGVYKTFNVTRRNRDQAIGEAETEIGDLIGRKLTSWSDQGKSGTIIPGGTESTGQTKGVDILTQREKSLENIIEVRLDGATEYTLTEIFGKVINTARGVVEAKRMSSQIVPDNPQASHVTWRLRIEDTDPFRLQANVMKMIHDILDAGGEIYLKGVPYRYTAAEVDLLKGLRPGEATTRKIQFVIDRDLARDKELQDRHDPYKAREKGKTSS